MRLVAIAIALIFVTTMFLGLALSTSSSHASTDCPFMNHAKSLCTMSVRDHIEKWKSIFLNVIPKTLSLLLFLFVAIVLSRATTKSLREKTLKKEWKKEKTKPIPLMQALFSKGILHPKIFS